MDMLCPPQAPTLPMLLERACNDITVLRTQLRHQDTQIELLKLQLENVVTSVGQMPSTVARIPPVAPGPVPGFPRSPPRSPHRSPPPTPSRARTDPHILRLQAARYDHTPDVSHRHSGPNRSPPKRRRSPVPTKQAMVFPSPGKIREMKQDMSRPQARPSDYNPDGYHWTNVRIMDIPERKDEDSREADRMIEQWLLQYCNFPRHLYHTASRVPYDQNDIEGEYNGPKLTHGYVPPRHWLINCVSTQARDRLLEANDGHLRMESTALNVEKDRSPGRYKMSQQGNRDNSRKR